MKAFLYRLLEEIFPFIFFIINKANTLKKVSNISEIEQKSEQYAGLSRAELNNRLEEEHERARKIDDKTSKFTLGLSISLTVLAAASASFVKFVFAGNYAPLIKLLCGVASIYMLLAGITALGALKTLPTYGYGTHHLLNLNQNGVNYLRQALYSQELINLIRQLRNESAYQLLRNGCFTLLIALSLSVVILTVKQQSNPVKKVEAQPVAGQPEQTPEQVREKIDTHEAGLSPEKKVLLKPAPVKSEATEKTRDNKDPATTIKQY